jgi:hypothetical protein
MIMNVALRKRNYSVYEISQALKEQGMALSATAVREVLAAEGFAPLPRHCDPWQKGSQLHRTRMTWIAWSGCLRLSSLSVAGGSERNIVPFARAAARISACCGSSSSLAVRKSGSFRCPTDAFEAASVMEVPQEPALAVSHALRHQPGRPQHTQSYFAAAAQALKRPVSVRRHPAACATDMRHGCLKTVSRPEWCSWCSGTAALPRPAFTPT